MRWFSLVLEEECSKACKVVSAEKEKKERLKSNLNILYGFFAKMWRTAASEGLTMLSNPPVK
jgi:hypothetical protein